jgi:hypothetical protein
MFKLPFFTFFMIFTSLKCHCSEIHHRILNAMDKDTPSFIWEQNTTLPFNELIVSWDAERPKTGAYLIRLSVFTHNWSPWLDYAYWSSTDQHTFHQQKPGLPIQTYQDALECLHGAQATGFRICVEAQNRADLQSLRGLHASATDLKAHQLAPADSLNCRALIELNVPKISQMALTDERKERLCSPASTTAVVKFLSPQHSLQPLSLADEVVDTAFDIYGNWILNSAQASHYLGPPWQCYVARLTSFQQVLDKLAKGFPVIVSVRGPLIGSALLYQSGHLLVVKGYDPKAQNVLCMDPAFPCDQETSAAYPLEDFLAAWKRRGCIAYIFDR